MLFYVQKGFVAVDDLSIHDGPCRVVNLCTFENNITCGYTNDPTADFEWKIGTGEELYEAYGIDMSDVCLTFKILVSRKIPNKY